MLYPLGIVLKMSAGFDFVDEDGNEQFGKVAKG